MNILSSSDLNKVNGGIYNFAAGAVIGYGMYGLKQTYLNQAVTVSGAITAAGFGGMTAGLGGILADAAGGGMAGNIAWRPGFAAINAAGQAIAAEQK